MAVNRSSTYVAVGLVFAFALLIWVISTSRGSDYDRLSFASFMALVEAGEIDEVRIACRDMTGIRRKHVDTTRPLRAQIPAPSGDLVNRLVKAHVKATSTGC